MAGEVDEGGAGGGGGESSVLDAESRQSRGDLRSYQAGGGSDASFHPSSGVGAAGDAPSAAAADWGGGGEAAGSSGVGELGGAGQAGAGAGDEYRPLRDSLQGLGWQFQREYADDEDILRDLVTQANRNREADYYAQLGRQLAPEYQGIQSYLQERKAQQQAPAQPREWEAPEFEQSWMGLVQRDAGTGVFLAKPGVNPVIADKVNLYDKWFQKYGANPAAAFRPMMEAELPRMLGGMLDQRFGEWQRQQQINELVRTNASWMYQADDAGRPVIGVGGTPVPTANGLRYSQHVANLERQGMVDPVQVDALARQLLMGEIAMGQLRQEQGQVAQPQRNQAIASGRPQANVLQSRTPQERMVTAGATEPDQSGMSLSERMARAFEQAGYTDADFREMPR